MIIITTASPLIFSNLNMFNNKNTSHFGNRNSPRSNYGSHAAVVAPAVFLASSSAWPHLPPVATIPGQTFKFLTQQSTLPIFPYRKGMVFQMFPSNYSTGKFSTFCTREWYELLVNRFSCFETYDRST